MIYVHTAEIRVPGSFVVMQGIPGDGMSNTMDSLPQWPPSYDDEEEDDDNNDDTDDENYENHKHNNDGIIQEEQLQKEEKLCSANNNGVPMETTDSHSHFMETTSTTASLPSSNAPFLPSTLNTTSFSSLAAIQQTQQAFLAAQAATTTVAPTPTKKDTLEESYMIVSDDDTSTPATNTNTNTNTKTTNTTHDISNSDKNDNNPSTNETSTAATSSSPSSLQPQVLQALQTWNEECRFNEEMAQQEWLEANCSYSPTSSSASSTTINSHASNVSRFANRTSTAAATTAAGTARSNLNSHAANLTTTSTSNSRTASFTNPGMRSSFSSSASNWWTENGCLCVLDGLPQRMGRRRIWPRRVGLLHPGTVLVGSELITLSTQTWTIQHHVLPTKLDHGYRDSHAASTTAVYAPCRPGHMQLLQLDSEPYAGCFVVISHNGYAHAAPGLPSTYADPKVWLWRVTCPVGAYVREGLDLSTKHVETIPYGALVQVRRKVVNALGLARLQVTAVIDRETPTPADELDIDDDDDDDNGDVDNNNNNISTRMHTSRDHSMSSPTTRTRTTVSSSSSSTLSTTTREHLSFRSPSFSSASSSSSSSQCVVIEGWCSEFLNPLSGQRGSILQPVPFPVPAIYRVVLSTGAVIRSGIELSSPVIGHAPAGSLLTVTGRVYSEHPADQCIERLRLAGNGGYTSVRLNNVAPNDHLIVELVGLHPNFDSQQPGLFHLQEMDRVYTQQQVQQLQQQQQSGTHNEEANQEAVQQLLGRRMYGSISSIEDTDEEEENNRGAGAVVVGAAAAANNGRSATPMSSSSSSGVSVISAVSSSSSASSSASMAAAAMTLVQEQRQQPPPSGPFNRQPTLAGGLFAYHPINQNTSSGSNTLHASAFPSSLQYAGTRGNNINNHNHGQQVLQQTPHYYSDNVNNMNSSSLRQFTTKQNEPKQRKKQLQHSKKDSQLQRKQEQQHCLVCLSDERNATIVHGGTGHICCCLVCARILKARRDPCPVCRLPIDLVIQHFWA